MWGDAGRKPVELVCAQKKRRGELAPAAPEGHIDLEDELSAQFKGSRILRAARLSEIASAEVVAKSVELSVVEGIEALHAQLKAAPLGHFKRLVEVGAEVGAPRADNGISAGIAKAEVRATLPRRCRVPECVTGDPLVDVAGPLLRVGRLLHHVGTNGVVSAEAHCVGTAVARSIGACPRKAGFGDDRTGEFPTAKDLVRHSGGMCKDRQLVHVVDAQDLPAIEIAGALVIPQVEWIANRGQIGAA